MSPRDSRAITSLICTSWGWTLTNSRTLAALAALALILLCLAPVASASGGYNVGISTIDYVSDIVYHANGTVSYGSGHGFYTVDNPAPTSPLISAYVTPYSGSLAFIGNIAPLSSYSGAYDVDHDNIRIPLIVKETITPASLTAGLQQQVNITVEVTNVASHDVTGFDYTKTSPRISRLQGILMIAVRSR